MSAVKHGTAIEWTHGTGFKGETWNPVTGCDRVSPGCAHCYALDLAARLKRMGQPRYQRDGGPASGPGFGVTLHPDKLIQPARWTKPRMVFVNSMSDLFHEEIPDAFIAQVFAVMATAERHVFQVLTKRPERARSLLSSLAFHCKVVEALPPTALCPIALPLPNVWLGVSIENRRFVGRADLLRATPAAVRFISAEPLLGPLLPDADYMETADHETYPVGDAPFNAWRPWADGYSGPGLNLEEIDWLIVGGESGPDHRPIRSPWWRERCSLNVGGTYAVCPGRGKHAIGCVVVARVERQVLGHLPNYEAIREGFASTAEFERVFAEINGSYDAEALVWRIVFRRVEASA